MATNSITICIHTILIFYLLMASSLISFGCKPSERKALLRFKHSLSFFNKTISSSWEGEDCCRWSRVSCDPTTGDVLKLQLRGSCDPTTSGVCNTIETEKLESSLQHLSELKRLEYLDLSNNDFSRSSMPKALGSMHQLRYLNLSNTNLFGEVPNELGNLTHLQFLDLSSYSSFFLASSLTLNKALGSMHQLRYLSLSNNYLYGEVPNELGNLTHLQFLDLSSSDSYITCSNLNWVSSLQELQYLDMSHTNLSRANDWVKSLIGPLPSLRELRLEECSLPTFNKTHINSSSADLPIQYLDLSGNYMKGQIPSFIQNLTSLEYLDLSSNMFDSYVPLWLGKHNRLTHLILSSNYLSDIEGDNIWGLVRNLCELSRLDLAYNHFTGPLLEPRENLSTVCTSYDMEWLDLSGNENITGNLPSWIGEKFRSLNYLTFAFNQLSGEIPTSLGMLSALETLDLSYNQLSGTIPASLGNLLILKILSLNSNNLSHFSSSLEFPATLEQIYLSDNQLTGQIPAKSLGQLSKLQRLDISSNYLLEGTVLSETHFSNLINLKTLIISGTFITLELSFDWMPPFQLDQLDARNCKVNGPFPQWLKTQKSLTTLYLSNASIFGPIPKWFETMELLSDVDLSYNKISGSPVFPFNFTNVDLSNNALSSLFILHDNHTTYPAALSVDFSNNFIKGKLPEDNHIYGPIPKSLCHLTYLGFLNLEKNNLSGSIPDCVDKLSRLKFVGLSSNKLSGKIPCFGSSENIGLFLLCLSDNSLTGQIPSCFGNATQLIFLDVGGNELSGKIPKWFTRESFPNMQILRLRDNKFSGVIPHEVCSLDVLHILDFAHNFLTGTIPHCLNELTFMNSPSSTSYSYSEGINEVILGIEREYTSTLALLVNIDLSCNKLVGSIPDEITNLSGLLGLNLSYNQLSGQIPRNIGGLRSLLSLDLSRNRLWGTIPTSMAAMNFLESLDVSYNNLSGPIPTGNQLQTLINPSIYAGNPYLCGDPLPRKCKSNHQSPDGSGDQGKQGAEDKDKHETVLWFYLVVMSGFATGFWVVVGTLVVKKSWRHALFRRVDDAQDWLYVAIVVRMS